MSLRNKIAWGRTTAPDRGLQKAASLACRHVLFGHSMFLENQILFPASTNQEILLTSPEFPLVPKKLEDPAILSPYFEPGDPFGW